MKDTFYQFQATSLNGDVIIMNNYAGKVVLVVNTASKCGLVSQFEGLETLYKKYRDQGLVILGFPCNQFANQEPNNNIAIKNHCQINYGVSFPMFSKIKVNGTQAHPLYNYLKKSLPGFIYNDIKWNFTKFLIARDGTPLQRFSPLSSPEKIEQFIQKALMA